MQPKTNTILGISPGTRSMGFAVVSDGELVNWGVKSYKGKWSDTKQAQILNDFHRIVADYQITRLAIKIHRPSHYTRNLHHLYFMFETSAMDTKLSFSSFTIGELESICLNAKNKQEMIHYIENRFPEMVIDHPKNMESTSVKVFEAIAAAVASS